MEYKQPIAHITKTNNAALVVAKINKESNRKIEEKILR